ncbi:hypothetical protein [Bacillus rhizoplanae]|uniref:hypothetical protein n=1 Tax=Bacillus rhizoplanae TaxID=2880966 RepID=UPI003D1FBA7F
MESFNLNLCLRIDGLIDFKEVNKVLIELGFKQRFNQKFNHFQWYRWFEKYQSITGCDFSIDNKMSVDSNGNQIYTLFKATTYQGRSYADLEMQNKVIGKMQQEFGGGLCDEDGLPTSFLENILPQLTSAEIVCDVEYGRFLNNLNKFNRLIEEVDEELLEDYHSTKDSGMKELFSSSLSNNDSLLRNNTLIPFAVATLEDFLKNFLVENLETNEKARDRIFQNDRKIKYSEIKEVLAGEKSLIDMEMDFYNFQNLESANNAYNKFFDFDIFKEVLCKETSLENKKVTILSVISELITIRHKVIHEAKIDYTLGKKKMKQYYAFLHLFGDEFMHKFRDKLELRNAFKELNYLEIVSRLKNGR